MNAQATLFDLAAVAPSRGERRAAAAAVRRQEKEQRHRRAELRRHERAYRRKQMAEAFPAVTCCLYWCPPGSGWTRCHGCGRLLSAVRLEQAERLRKTDQEAAEPLPRRD